MNITYAPLLADLLVFTFLRGIFHSKVFWGTNIGDFLLDIRYIDGIQSISNVDFHSCVDLKFSNELEMKINTAESPISVS